MKESWTECEEKKFASISILMDELFIYQYQKYKTVLNLLKREKITKRKKRDINGSGKKFNKYYFTLFCWKNTHTNKSLLYYHNWKKPEQQQREQHYQQTNSVESNEPNKRWNRKIDFKWIQPDCVRCECITICRTKLNQRVRIVKLREFNQPEPIPCFWNSIIIKYKLNGTEWQFHFINFDFISNAFYPYVVVIDVDKTPLSANIKEKIVIISHFSYWWGERLYEKNSSVSTFLSFEKG